MSLRSALLVGLSLATAVMAQSQEYGYNHPSVSKDSDTIVGDNFPDVNITLLSPAFLNPESVPDGFKDGTDGPTDIDELSET